MVVQETCTQGIGRGIALLQVIDLIPFGEDTILSDSLQGACLVLLEQLFPTADVAIARPILARETGLLIGGDIVGQSSLLWMVYSKHSKKYTLHLLGFGCSFALAMTIKP